MAIQIEVSAYDGEDFGTTLLIKEHLCSSREDVEEVIDAIRNAASIIDWPAALAPPTVNTPEGLWEFWRRQFRDAFK